MSPSIYVRATLAIFLTLVGILYVAAVLSGLLEKDRQLDGADLALLGLALLGTIALVRPSWLRRLRLFELMGFRVEFDKLKGEIDGLRVVLFMLLLPHERSHLLNLAEGSTQRYRAHSGMRNELRKLRNLGLIKNRPGKTIGGEDGMREKDVDYNLADFVELTEAGEFVVGKLKEQEKAA